MRITPRDCGAGRLDGALERVQRILDVVALDDDFASVDVRNRDGGGVAAFQETRALEQRFRILERLPHCRAVVTAIADIVMIEALPADEGRRFAEDFPQIKTL